MDIDQIINIASFVLTVLIFAWGLYEQVKGKAAASASAFIAQVESSGLVGKEKMALVVDWLYELIPAPFKRILNKTALEKLAQTIFDYMKKYANAYIEAKKGKGKEAYKPVNDELAEEIAKKLVGVSLDGLRLIAENLGAQTEGMDETELIKEIVCRLMEGYNNTERRI